ncbi:zinc-finger-containing protein [Corallococcus carmarthensis]|uniref:zinc-finger-containing protein n=1 Tax=Corallococcus carmarthensis TaxID=2316728 RepID=UPI001C10229F
MIDKYPIPTSCPYCCSAVIYTSNAVIYGREYGNGRCYKCTKCDAYVGVHNRTNIPLGRLANRELRELKKECHALFDPIWKQNKRIKREHAYERLAKVLGIPVNECHFGWFDKEMLLEAREILSRPDWYKG